MRTHSIAKYVAGVSAAVLVAALAAFAGCSQSQSEGVRCNPTLASGETDCNDGLTCTQPSLCAENYCCPVDSTGKPTPSTNPFCQTGCNGGAASLCNVGVDDAGECAFACANDRGDLLNSSVCAGEPEGGAAPDGAGGPDAAGDTGAVDAGGGDASKDAAAVDAGGGDAESSDAAADGSSDASDASDGGVADGATD